MVQLGRLAGASLISLVALSLSALACGDSATNGDGSGGKGGSGSGGAGSRKTTSATTTLSGPTTSTGDASTGTSTASGETCLGSDLLTSLGKTHLMPGVTTSDAVAASAPFDLRYQYISGGIQDGDIPCDSCASSCTASGASCANSNPNGCAWWGCWQYDQDPPGAYVRSFVSTSLSKQQIPMISYYMVLQASGVKEGQPEVDVMNDSKFLTRYLGDYRFLLEQFGQSQGVMHIEPDFWGYAEQDNGNPHLIPAAVPGANPTDCADQEASIAGLGRCMVAMARKYAPNVKVSLHGSAWATKMDVLGNTDASFDVAGEAGKLGAFLEECAPDADLVVVDAADRDAGYYESIGRDDWWDDTNATLPNFTQAFAWSKAVSEKYGKPNLWWQVPVGNMSQTNMNDHWKDNRLDYFFAHWDEVAASHGIGAAFGAGAGGQTTPETDGGNLVSRTKAYGSSGGQALCP